MKQKKNYCFLFLMISVLCFKILHLLNPPMTNSFAFNYSFVLSFLHSFISASIHLSIYSFLPSFLFSSIVDERLCLVCKCNCTEDD